MSATDFKTLVGKKVGNTNGTFAPAGKITQFEIRDGKVVSGINSSLAADAGGTVTSIGTGAGLSGGPITSTGTISIAPSGVSAGVYGSSSNIPIFNVDTTGRLTSASSTPFALGPSGVAAGSYSPDFTFTVNSQGLITSATSVPIVSEQAILGDPTFTGGMALTLAVNQISPTGVFSFSLQSTGGPGINSNLGNMPWMASAIPPALQNLLPSQDTHFLIGNQTSGPYLLRLGPSGIFVFANENGTGFPTGNPGPTAIFKTSGTYSRFSVL